MTSIHTSWRAAAADHREIEERMIAHVVDRHRRTGGGRESVIDVSCGSGESTRALAQHFTAALGLDRSEENIQWSRAVSDSLLPIEGVRGTIEFAVAEEGSLVGAIKDFSKNGKVDMVIVCGVVSHIH